MSCPESHELAALDAVGALDPAGKARLEARTAGNAEARAEVAGLRDAAAVLALAYSKPALLHAPVVPIALGGFSFVHQHESAWAETPIPGLKVKILSVNNREGCRVILAQLAPGARFPRHIHKTGPEELFVVSGDLETEGRTLRAGDFLHAESGTEHRGLYSPHGCVVLLVEPVEGPEIPMAEK